MASWRTLSGRSSLPWVQGWGSVWWLGWGMGTAAPCKSSSGQLIPLLSCRKSLREERISLVVSSIHLGPKGDGPGSLLSMHTLWNRSLISPQEVWYPTSWMAGTSTSGSSPGRPCQWLQQINLSASLYPDLAVCANILWRMMGWCGPPNLPLWVFI